VYDFSRCKLCGQNAAAPKYKLKQMSLYACSNCDFHYIDVLDDFPDEQPGKSLLTEKARNFIESKLPQNAIQLKKDLEFVKAHVALAGVPCLDIGAGAGLFPSLLKEAGAVPHGIEPQQIFREFALEKFQISLRRELIDDPYWQNEYAGYFDVVTLWDTLEHVNFPAETIKAASRLIKPGGYLFLDTPSRDSFFYRVSEWSCRLSQGSKALLLNSLYSPKPYCHKQIFTTAQLWALLENSGFSVVGRSSLHRSGNKLVVACRKSCERGGK
jgi:2-polyprenyl-6-hydroxyphenyl methylase/3-demethylubiquinone-9 3-methyltransferase